MEVHLTPEKEALLKQMATRAGKNTVDLVQEAVDRLLDYDAWCIKEVEKGQAQAEGEELINHEDLVARIEKRIQTRQSHP
jgi:predicted transcriptional regulator